MEISKLIDLFILLCVLTSIIKLNSIKGPDVLIAGIVWLELVVSLIVLIFFVKGQQNIWIFSIANLFEYSLMFLFYSIVIKNWVIKIVLKASIPLIFIGGTINLIWFQGFNVANTLTEIPEYIIIAFVSYLYIRTRIFNDTFTLRDMRIIFSVANLIYHTISVPVITLMPYLYPQNKLLAEHIFVINNYAFILWLLIITFGFLWKKPQPILFT